MKTSYTVIEICALNGLDSVIINFELVGDEYYQRILSDNVKLFNAIEPNMLQ